MCIFILNVYVFECVHAYVNLFMNFYMLFNLCFYRWQQSHADTVVTVPVTHHPLFVRLRAVIVVRIFKRNLNLIICIRLLVILIMTCFHSLQFVGTVPRRGRGRGRGEGRGGGGRTGVRQATKNVSLRNAVRDFGPQAIEFDYNDQGTFTHVGNNAKWFSNYCGELIREFPLWYESWHKIEEEKKAHVIPQLSVSYSIFLLYCFVIVFIYFNVYIYLNKKN